MISKSFLWSIPLVHLYLEVLYLHPGSAASPNPQLNEAGRGRRRGTERGRRREATMCQGYKKRSERACFGSPRVRRGAYHGGTEATPCLFRPASLSLCLSSMLSPSSHAPNPFPLLPLHVAALAFIQRGHDRVALLPGAMYTEFVAGVSYDEEREKPSDGRAGGAVLSQEWCGGCPHHPIAAAAPATASKYTRATAPVQPIPLSELPPVLPAPLPFLRTGDARLCEREPQARLAAAAPPVARGGRGRPLSTPTPPPVPAPSSLVPTLPE
eukprot:356534-Chlamydomonas_euryale.AAC.4